MSLDTESLNKGNYTTSSLETRGEVWLYTPWDTIQP